MTEYCYLCGEGIETDRSVDHVSPKHFFAPTIRNEHNLSQLLTLPTHGACNKSFEKDEEYFAWSLVPLALDSVGGEALVRHHAKAFARGRSRGLALTTFEEFERHPSGLHLPNELVVKRVDGERIVRVLWKIVRGLYRLQTGAVLDESTLFMPELFEPQVAVRSTENPLWEAVKAEDGKGAYPGVFDYKYLFAQDGSTRLHVWEMLFWDRIMAFIAHREPGLMDNQHTA